MSRRFDTHRTTSGESITVLKLEKSGGCADRDDTFMKQTRQHQIREYFFGDSRRTLSPHTQTVDFSGVTIFKIREANSIFASFLPGDDDGAADTRLFDKVEPTSQMLHCILAVMLALPHDSQDTIRDAPVMGFVYVAEVDEKKKKLRLLAPLNAKLGDRPLVWGSWPEAAVSLI
jgi:polyribonucleotide 5'-hydroxyl-kinase